MHTFPTLDSSFLTESDMSGPMASPTFRSDWKASSSRSTRSSFLRGSPAERTRAWEAGWPLQDRVNRVNPG